MIFAVCLKCEGEGRQFIVPIYSPTIALEKKHGK